MAGFNHSTPFSVFLSKNPRETKHRIVVSKKVSKKAVERNLIKRRVKSILQTTSAQQPLVILCRPSTLSLSFGELAAALLPHVKRANT